MRCLTVFAVFVLIAVLALTGYNHWRINQIYNLEIVKSKLNISKPAPTGESDDLTNTLELAGQHAHKARVLLSKGKNSAAREELDKSLRKLEKATELSRETSVSSNLDKTLSAVQKQVQGALEGISKEAVKRKPEGKE